MLRRARVLVTVLPLAACGSAADDPPTGAGTETSTNGTTTDVGEAGSPESGEASGETGGETGVPDPTTTGGGSDETTGAPVDEFCPDGERVPIRIDDEPLPVEADHYACRVIAVPTDGLRHVIGFAPHVVDPHAHHMILYRAADPLPEGPVQCFTDQTFLEYQFAWGAGGGPFSLPDEAGFLMGATPDGVTYYVLETHINNPIGDVGVLGETGIDLCVTSQLREHDASLFVLGKIAGIDIPAGEPAWPETSVCPGELTASIFEQPEVAFASMLHTHALGREIWTEQWRDGRLLRELSSNHRYDWQSQSTVRLDDFEILPGDELRTTCIYDASKTTAAVPGGTGTGDEMCIDFLMVYPAVPYWGCGLDVPNR
jgi:hypothetical protein